MVESRSPRRLRSSTSPALGWSVIEQRFFRLAAFFTAVYVLIIECFVYRDVEVRKDLPRIVIESMTMLGAVLIILATAVGFTGWMLIRGIWNLRRSS